MSEETNNNMDPEQENTVEENVAEHTETEMNEGAENVSELTEEGVIEENEPKYIDDEFWEQPKKTISKGAVAAIVAVVLAVAAVLTVLIVDPFEWNVFNSKEKTQSAEVKEIKVDLPKKSELSKKELKATEKYNSMYPDLFGTTIGEYADAAGMEFDDFIEYYNLPSDMTQLVNAYAATNLMPIKEYMEKFTGIDFSAAKEFYEWDDTVTEETPSVDALDKVTMEKRFGVDSLDQIKETYGLGDDVTGETLYGEVRPIMEKKELELKKQAEEAEKATEAPTENGDAPAENSAAPKSDK